MLVAAFAGRERVLAAYRRGDRGALPVLQLRRRDANNVGGAERRSVAYIPPVKFTYDDFDLSGVRTYPLASRQSKARVEDFAQPYAPGAGLKGAARLDALDPGERRLQGGGGGDPRGARARIAASSGALARMS